MKRYRITIYHPIDKEVYVHWSLEAKSMGEAMVLFANDIQRKWPNKSLQTHIEIKEENG